MDFTNRRGAVEQPSYTITIPWVCFLIQALSPLVKTRAMKTEKGTVPITPGVAST